MPIVDREDATASSGLLSGTLSALVASTIETGSLLDLVPDLGDRLPAVALNAARDRSHVVVHRFERGPWDPTQAWAGKHPAFGLLVVEGMLLRELAVATQRSSEPFGSGDLICRQPSRASDDGAREQWRALAAGRVARLDARLIGQLADAVLVFDALAGRSTERGRLLGMVALTRAMRRTDARLMVMLMALALRWGRMRPDGIRLTLPVNHDQLAALIGTRRQAVTTALGQLRAARRLSNLPGGDWLLSVDLNARTPSPAPMRSARVSAQTVRGLRPADGRVSLLALDPRHLAAVPPEERGAAELALQTATTWLRRGRWDPGRDADEHLGWLGLLVVDGFLTRETRYDDHAALEILGPGDLLRPWDDETHGLLGDVRWRALVPTRIALLDQTVTRGAATWPAVLAELLARAGRRARWFNARLLTNEHARLETRIIWLLARLATRWASMPSGSVPVALTHAQLGQLVGAHRPSVTKAVGRLRADGALSVLPDGRWQVAAGPQPMRSR